MKPGKVVFIVLDGVGIGALPDARVYGDEGANTIGNTARAVGNLKLPHLQSLGLGNIADVPGIPPSEHADANPDERAGLSAANQGRAGKNRLISRALNALNNSLALPNARRQ